MSRLTTLRQSIRLIVRAAPKDVLSLALLKMIFGAGPAVLLLVGKNVIDQTVSLVGTAGGAPVAALLSDPLLLWSVVAYVVIHLALYAADTLSTFQVTSLRDRVE